MLSYTKDGKNVVLLPIGENGKIGQMLIFDYKNAVENAGTSQELHQYTPPAIFTIVEITKGQQHYILKDCSGNCVEVDAHSLRELYDAQKWLAWNASKEAYMEAMAKSTIVGLEAQLSITKEILIAQGHPDYTTVTDKCVKS